MTDIVVALRETLAQLNADASMWARLDHVIALVEEELPAQTPNQCGCKSWRQVLKESRVFDLEYRKHERGRRVAWLRERGE